MSERVWTREQAAAIRSTGPTLLEANAGTGKTTTVVGAILWRLGFDVGRDEDGTPLGPCPEASRITLDRLAAITFTEKAAYDLKQKLRDAIAAERPDLLWQIDRAAIGTIHSFCADALKEHALRFRLDPAFTVLDERESGLELELLARDVVLEGLAADDPGTVALVERYPFERRGEHGTTCLDHVLDAFRVLRWHPQRFLAWLRDGRFDRDALATAAGEWTAEDAPPLELCETLARLAADLFTRWDAFLKDEGTRDFDALILDLRARLADPAMAPALQALRRRFRFFVIDEFQDTDDAQWEIARAIAALGGPAGAGPQLWLVGDPKQSIYRFRGADVAVWNQASAAVPEEGRLKLTRNFRSTPAVVAFANRVSAPALEETAKAVRRAKLPSAIAYSMLEPARKGFAGMGVTWLVSGGKAEERRDLEGGLVAAEIRRIAVDEERGDTEGVTIVDPGSGEERPCRYRDIAILFRTRTSVKHLTPQLEHYGVPYYLAGDAGLKGRMEVLDVLTLLRLLENPLDDLRAFAFLRSPFVGLRDEVIARIRLTDTKRPLLRAAQAFLEAGEWPAAPEHDAVAAVERESLANALSVLADLGRMPARAPLHRLADEALERLGYRLHLLLRPQPASRLANLERFIGLLEGARHHTVGTFLELWDRWEDSDQGIPQAPLYSKRDDVVTLSTVHSAKGLEWPVVFLVDTTGKLKEKTTNSLVADRALGPVLFPVKDDRGARTDLIAAREKAESDAEEARLMYVAVTRARDRLYVAAPQVKPEGVAKWLAAGIQKDVTIQSAVADVTIPPAPPEAELEWLGRVAEGAPGSDLVGVVRGGALRPARSATEIMARLRSGPEWRSRWVHGIVPARVFEGSGAGGQGSASAGGGLSGVPGWIRGTLIHGVLERIRDEEELADLLEVAIGALESPEVEERLAPGTAYRAALEEEVRRIVASEQWKWYVEGAHWRELDFVHLRRPGRWRIGAFDLYRPADPRALIVDFKTHPVPAEAVPDAAAKYAAQVAVYRAAARAAGHEADVRLHFTGPGVVWEARQPGAA